MAAQNSSQQFPQEACLIADLPTDVQHQILNIGNYVFRPLSFILAFLSLVCNRLVIIAVTRTRSLQYPAMVMMCSLALTDVIFSLYSLYRYIELFTHEHMCPNSHPLHSAISALCAQATLGTLTVISRDRHVATRSPLWYRNHVTKSRAFKIVCIPWLISVVIAVVLYFSKNFEGVGKSLAQTLIPVPFALYVIVIMSCYLSIYFPKTIEVGNLNEALLECSCLIMWLLFLIVVTTTIKKVTIHN